MCAISCRMTLFRSMRWTCAELALHEPFRKRHGSGILHGANGQIGDDQLIVFLERVSDPEILLVECQTCA